MKVCATPRCPNLTTATYCGTCQQGVRAHHQRFQRGGNLYGRRWRKASRAWLNDAAHPDRRLCVDCRAEGMPPRLAEEVDHIIPHRGDRVLFWDETNWQGLCRSHHAEKTASETIAVPGGVSGC